MTVQVPEKPNVRQRRRQQQIDFVVNEAARLFAQQGFANTGVAELCETLQMGRGQLYNIIESKEKILLLIHERFTDRLFEGADRVESLGLPPANRLRAMLRDLVEAIAEHKDYVSVFFSEWRSLSEENRATYRARRRLYQDRIEHILLEGQKSGEFRVPNTRLAVLGIIGMANSSFQWIDSMRNMSPSDVADLLGDMFLHGIVIDGVRSPTHNRAGRGKP